MANLGKKLLSAFIEVSDDKKEDAPTPPPTPKPVEVKVTSSSKFAAYFDKLFNEANIPGPDYFEFSKMIEVMKSIPDERIRYTTAFAGLCVQGLDKQKLMNTAAQYIDILNNDAVNFNNTVDVALQEKVHEKQKSMEAKAARIQQLTEEIAKLQQELVQLQQEIKENEEKIEANTGGYKAESEAMKNRIATDIEKIKQYIP